jgi:hypothetical protein
MRCLQKLFGNEPVVNEHFIWRAFKAVCAAIVDEQLLARVQLLNSEASVKVADACQELPLLVLDAAHIDTARCCHAHMQPLQPAGPYYPTKSGRKDSHPSDVYYAASVHLQAYDLEEASRRLHAREGRNCLAAVVDAVHDGYQRRRRAVRAARGLPERPPHVWQVQVQGIQEVFGLQDVLQSHAAESSP